MGGRAGSSPRLGPTPLAGNRTSCKRPERRGVGEGEARGLYKSAPNTPGVGAAKSSFATVPWQMNTSHANTRIPNLLANKMPSVNIPKKKMHIQPSYQSSAKHNMPPKGLFKSRPIHSKDQNQHLLRFGESFVIRHSMPSGWWFAFRPRATISSALGRGKRGKRKQSQLFQRGKRRIYSRDIITT